MRASCVSVARCGGQTTHTLAKDETKMMNMQIYFIFFYFVFVAFFVCRKKEANAINGRRLTPCRHLSTSAQLCSWEMKLFSIFCINFLIRRVCDRRQMGSRAAATQQQQLAGWMWQNVNVIISATDRTGTYGRRGTCAWREKNGNVVIIQT